VLNIYNIEKSNYVNGNGNRYVLWLQGCDLGCVGCWNQQTWSFEDKTLKSVDEIFEELMGLEDSLDGITFSGGEPFLQAKELSLLAKKIKKNTNLGIQIFSGYELEELVKEEDEKLLKYTDVLVAGRFDQTKENNNQKVYILNDSQEFWEFDNTDVEIEIDDDLNIKMTGYPTDRLINEVREI